MTTRSISTAFCLLLTTSAANAEYIPVAVPGARTTYAYDALGSKVVGASTDASGRSTAFIYDDQSRAYKTLDIPSSGAPSTTNSYAYGIDNRYVYGTYDEVGMSGTVSHGYRYDQTNGTVLIVDIQGRATSYTYDARGSTLVGAGQDSPGGRTTAYAYDTAGNVVATIDAAGSTNTYAYGVDDRTIVGSYDTTSGGTTTSYAYTYDRTSGVIRTIDPVAGARNTYAYDVDGRNVYGTYQDSSGRSHGYVYDMVDRTTYSYDVAGSTQTYLHGTYGPDSYIGYYTYDNGAGGFVTQGFYQPTPAPPGILMMAIGAGCLAVPPSWRRFRAGTSGTSGTSRGWWDGLPARQCRRSDRLEAPSTH